MGLISPAQAADNTTPVNAASVNNPVNTIADEFNGKIDDANIKPAAGIATSKLAQDNGPLAIKPVIAYKFNVYLTAAQNVGTADTKVAFDTKNFDTSSNVDIVTNKGRFTAPVAGFYHFDANVTTTTAGIGTGLGIVLYKNGVAITNGNKTPSNAAGTDPAAHLGATIQLAQNDYVEVFVNTGAAAKALNVGGASLNTFSGYLVSV